MSCFTSCLRFPPLCSHDWFLLVRSSRFSLTWALLALVYIILRFSFGLCQSVCRGSPSGCFLTSVLSASLFVGFLVFRFRFISYWIHFVWTTLGLFLSWYSFGISFSLFPVRVNSSDTSSVMQFPEKQQETICKKVHTIMLNLFISSLKCNLEAHYICV